jgi:peptide/nickel transport system permease protein
MSALSTNSNRSNRPSSARNKWMFWKRDKPTRGGTEKDETFYRAGQWQLVWWKFRRHKLAQIAMVVLGIFYFIAIFSEFVSPYDPQRRFKDFSGMSPVQMHIRDTQGSFHLPFVYDIKRARDPVTLRPVYTEDTNVRYPVVLFARGDEYKMWGFIPGNVHLFGVRTEGDKLRPLFLLGSDTLGHDLLSRIFFGARISLTVGLIGIFLAFVLGLVLGGIAGFFGGVADEVIMRFIDVLISLPTIPLWMSLAAALPQDWPQLKTYFYVTIILSILGWTTLARTVRGKMLSLREEDYVMAAKLDGESEAQIIARYMLPGFASYIIVSLTLSIPGMILGETALSFLGVGLRPPTISWGVMLQDAQSLQTIAQLPWLLWPVAFVVVAVLMFNFLGDGLRDAADPYVTG